MIVPLLCNLARIVKFFNLPVCIFQNVEMVMKSGVKTGITICYNRAVLKPWLRCAFPQAVAVAGSGDGRAWGVGTVTSCCSTGTTSGGTSRRTRTSTSVPTSARYAAIRVRYHIKTHKDIDFNPYVCPICGYKGTLSRLACPVTCRRQSVCGQWGHQLCKLSGHTLKLVVHTLTNYYWS